jgi:hypothetical protein
MPESQELAESTADEIAALSWEDLDAYGERAELQKAPSGRTFKVRSRAFWDMDEWASGMNISVKVRRSYGLRRLWGYKAWRTRGGPDDLVPERPST